MNFANDLNLLAANNVIGYDTYSQAINAVRPGSYGYNPYGVGKLNTGVTKDTFTKKPANAATVVGGTALAISGLSVGSRILNELKTTTTKKGKQTKTFINKVKKSLGFKTTAKRASRTSKAAAKTAKTGFKSVIGKIGKGFKFGAIAAGIGAVAVGALKFVQAKNIYQAQQASYIDQAKQQALYNEQLKNQALYEEQAQQQALAQQRNQQLYPNGQPKAE